MALIMYFTRIPRYKNILTDEYETIPRDDIVLIEKYFNWKRVRETGNQYNCDSLEDWCGIPESKLPHKYVVNYYRDFYTPKKQYVEYVGEVEGYSLFEQLARFAKVNQVFNWFIKNVMGGKVDQEYYEVTKKQFEELLGACNKVRSGFTNIGEDEYTINEELAKEYLPLMEEQGYMFGLKEYSSYYAVQVIEMIDIISNILDTTDFEKQTVYFNAIW